MQKPNLMTVTIITLLSWTSFSVHANPDVTGQLHACSKVESDTDRLNCYDDLTQQLKSSHNLIVEPKAVVQKPAVDQQPKSVAVATPIPLPKPANPNQAMPKQSTAHNSDTIVLSKKDSFGKKASELVDIESISSNIVGEFKGWRKGDVVKLANGQRWKVNSNDSGYVKLNNPKVVVSKGFWGSFNMKVEGLNAKAKVKRVD